MIFCLFQAGQVLALSLCSRQAALQAVSAPLQLSAILPLFPLKQFCFLLVCCEPSGLPLIS